MTVAKAYRDIEVMDILNVRRGVGYSVNPGAVAKCQEECREGIIARLHMVAAEAKAAGMSGAEIKKACPASYNSDSALYGEVRDAAMGLVKKGQERPTRNP